MDRWLYRARAGAFGMVIVEHADVFTVPFVPLPRREPSIADIFRWTEDALMPRGLFAFMAPPAEVRPDTGAPPTPDALRAQKEAAARGARQPFEWASHVYVTVGGEVRWRCCGNLFDDDHSAYCQNPDDAMGHR